MNGERVLMKNKNTQTKVYKQHLSKCVGGIARSYSVLQDKFATALENFTLTKRRLAAILLNQSFNNFEICLICYFLGIEPSELTQPTLPETPVTVRFDNGVRELNKEGISMNQIALRMNVDHEAIRQILKGTYDIEKSQTAKHRPSKFDWNRIDQECSNRLTNLIRSLREKGIPITKRNLSAELGLKDISWRSLPKTKGNYRKMKFNG
jgi:hypothetical protein